MEKIKDFWNNKTQEERRKIIVYGIAGLFSLLLIVGVVALNSTNEAERVSDISNPDSKEAQKYNSRAEANQMGKVDSTQMNTAMDNLFGESDTETNGDVFTDGESYSEPSYSQQTYSEPSYTQQNTQGYSSGSTRGGNYNSHSTYGDYSMWQSDEPKNNSIGYTEVRNYPSQKKGQPTAKKSEQATISTPDYIPEPTYAEPNYAGSQSQDIRTGKQIRAKLLSQGFATSGRSLSFVLLDNANISGENIKKGQVITGVASEQNNRLLVNFSTIKANNKIIPVQMELYGSDGMAGLPISGSAGGSNLGNEAKERAGDYARGQVNRIPVIGGVISGVVGGGNRTADNRIKLTPNIQCIIVNYN